MSYNTKNYTTQGGDETHIGGKLIIDDGGAIQGWEAEAQADSTATTVDALKADFNALLGKLKEAGLMASE